MTFSDPYRRFQGHRVAIGLDGLNVLCVQPTCDLFVIAKLFYYASTAYAAPEASCFALSVATLSVPSYALCQIYFFRFTKILKRF